MSGLATIQFHELALTVEFKIAPAQQQVRVGLKHCP